MHGNDEKKLPDLAIVSRPIDCRNASLSKRKCSLVRYHVSYVIKYPLYNRLHQEIPSEFSKHLNDVVNPRK